MIREESGIMEEKDRDILKSLFFKKKLFMLWLFQVSIVKWNSETGNPTKENRQIHSHRKGLNILPSEINQETTW